MRKKEKYMNDITQNSMKNKRDIPGKDNHDRSFEKDK